MVSNSMIGERIAEIRSKRGLSQDDVATAAQISRQYLSKIENGRVSPTVDLLRELMRAIGSSLVALLDIRVPDAFTGEDAEVHNKLQQIMDSGGERSTHTICMINAMHRLGGNGKKRK